MFNLQSDGMYCVQAWDGKGFMFCEHRVRTTKEVEVLLKDYNNMKQVTAKAKGETKCLLL